MATFRSGDTVVLFMRVTTEADANGDVVCTWEVNGEQKTGTFSEEALALVEDTTSSEVEQPRRPIMPRSVRISDDAYPEWTKRSDRF